MCKAALSNANALESSEMLGNARAHGSERIRNEVLKYLILNQLKFWKKIEFELDSCNRDELEVASCGCSILSTSNVNWDAQ